MSGLTKSLAVIYRYASILWLLLVVATFLIVYFKVEYYFWAGIVFLIGTIIIGALQLPKAYRLWQWFFYMVPPLLLVIYSWWIFSIVPQWAYWIVMLVAAVVGIVYWQAWMRLPNTNQKEEFFTTVTGSIGLINAFLLFSSLLSAVLLLNLPVVWIIAIGAPSIFLLIYFSNWLLPVHWAESLLYAIIMTIVMTQFLWVITFLPISYFVSALILTIIFYVLTGLSRFRLVSRMSKAVVARYMTISILIIIVLLFTSQWL